MKITQHLIENSCQLICLGTISFKCFANHSQCSAWNICKLLYFCHEKLKILLKIDFMPLSLYHMHDCVLYNRINYKKKSL